MPLIVSDSPVMVTPPSRSSRAFVADPVAVPFTIVPAVVEPSAPVLWMFRTPLLIVVTPA